MCNNKELFFEISKLSVTVLRSISGIRDIGKIRIHEFPTLL